MDAPIPVDLSVIREITGGDADLDRRVIGAFLQAVAEYIPEMEANRHSEASHLWKVRAHALKGSSLSLGAARLGALCAEAEHNFAASPEHKLRLITAIRTEFEQVKQFLEVNV